SAALTAEPTPKLDSDPDPPPKSLPVVTGLTPEATLGVVTPGMLVLLTTALAALDVSRLFEFCCGLPGEFVPVATPEVTPLLLFSCPLTGLAGEAFFAGGIVPGHTLHTCQPLAIMAKVNASVTLTPSRLLDSFRDVSVVEPCEFCARSARSLISCR